MIYFAYGSNLSLRYWRVWCERHGFEPGGLVPRGPAFLPDHHPVFHYRSRSWDGGALDVTPAPGTATPGMLFEADPQTWRALDAKEGAPRFYRRQRVHVLDARGDLLEAWTYVVTRERRRGFVPPCERYIEVVREGLRAFGLPSVAFERAAAGHAAAPSPAHLFVYGTLMTGERSHHFLTQHRARLVGRGQTRGVLYDIGPYPGLRRGQRTVQGEVFEIASATIFDALDPWEDFEGYGLPGSVYWRVLAEVEVAGRALTAWTYRYEQEPAGARIVPSGDWRRR